MEIIVECQITLTDWMGMIDEMIGLILHHRTPFTFNISKLNIHNFHMRQTRHFKWLLSMLEKRVTSSRYHSFLALTLVGLDSETPFLVFKMESKSSWNETETLAPVIVPQVSQSSAFLLQQILYFTLSGYYRSMSRIFYDFSEEFSQLANVHVYGMAATGPNVLAFSHLNDPGEQEVLKATCEVYSHWNLLKEVYYNRVSLSNKLEALLSVVPGPMKTIYCYHCYLMKNDLSYLAETHHAEGVENLNLEYNNLQGLSEYLCTFLRRAPHLKILNLKGTGMTEEERIGVLCALQECPDLDTLVLFEDDGMVSSECYQTMTQLACTLPNLKTFFMFPLRYEPFDKIYRKSVVNTCKTVLTDSGRNDLQLWY